MQHNVDSILTKPDDYKLCKSCGVINWYENKQCHACKSFIFKPIGMGIHAYGLKIIAIRKEVEFDGEEVEV